MLTLSLLRHAKSSWEQPSLGDHERPLAKRGRKAAPKVGAALAGMRLTPDLVLCSGAVRTRETVSLVLPKFPAPRPQVIYDDSIYMATPDTLLVRVRRVGTEHAERLPRHMMVVGHNPGLEDLTILLTGSGSEADMALISEKFPTCAVAIINFEADNWTEINAGAGRLLHFIVPRDLP